jgi:pilus assembly protein Flp/PilA
MQTIKARARLHDRSERGAGLIEYALLVALIAVVCIAAVTFFGQANSSKLDEAGTGVAGGAARDCWPSAPMEDGTPTYIVFNADRTAYEGPFPGTC